MFLRGGDPYIRYTLVSERNLSIVIYLDPGSAYSNLYLKSSL